MRSGQTPAVAKRACFSDGSLGEEEGWLVASATQLSPSGNAAALAWTDADERTGVVLAHAQPGQDAWLVPESDITGSPDGCCSTAALSWSPSGRWLGNLRHAPGGVQTQLCDVAQRSWLPRLHVTAQNARVLRQSVAFTDCECLAAAKYTCTDAASNLISCPVIWGFSLALPPLGKSHAWGWLPGSTSLLIWCDCRLARFDLNVDARPSSQQLQLQWVPQPTELLPGTDVCLTFLPRSQMAATMHCTRAAGSAATHVELALHSAADLSTLSSVIITVSACPSSRGKLCASVAASAHAVAASFCSIPQPTELLPGTDVCLTFLPRSQMAATVHCTRAAGSAATHVELALHSAADLSTLSSVIITVSACPSSRGKLCASVAASAHAVAASFCSIPQPTELLPGTDVCLTFLPRSQMAATVHCTRAAGSAATHVELALHSAADLSTLSSVIITVSACPSSRGKLCASVAASAHAVAASFCSIPQPTELLPGTDVCLTFLPRSQMAATMHCTRAAGSAATHVELALHSAADLSTLSSVIITVSACPSSRGKLCASVAASAHAVAASFCSIPQPTELLPGTDVCLTFLPRSQMAATMHCTRAAGSAATHVELALHSAADLSTLSSVIITVSACPSSRGKLCASVAASAHAVAASFCSIPPTDVATYVYAVDSCGLLGPCLFSETGLAMPSFSPGGQFLTGRVTFSQVRVLDATTEACLVSVDEQGRFVTTVVWAGRQLQVTAAVGGAQELPGMSFAILAW